jgi:nucleotide-binding universal stress UspA family protein
MKPSEGIESRVKYLIVPLDGSRLSEEVLPITTQLVQKLGAPLTLLHLIERNAPQQIHGEHHLSDPEEAELIGHPVLVVLHGTLVDGQVLPIAATLAKACGVKLQLVMVVPTLRTLSGAGAASGLLMPATTTKILELAYADASEYLSRQIAVLQAEGLHAFGEVLRGEPSEIVVKTARGVAPDVIVLGIHDEEGFAGTWSNSAVSKVASSTGLPLLLVQK